jgi:hypothetical protein
MEELFLSQTPHSFPLDEALFLAVQNRTEVDYRSGTNLYITLCNTKGKKKRRKKV